MMRRARIKVMATVPARRKVIKDANEENGVQPEMAAPAVTQPNEKLDNRTQSVEEKKPDVEELVHKKENRDQVVDSPANANECLTDETAAPSLSSALEEAGETQTAAENNESQVLEASAEKDNDEGVKQKAQRVEETEERISRPETISSIPEPAEPKGCSSVENTPTTKQLSQTRASFMRPSPRLDGGGSRIRRNSVQGSGASASESEDDSHRRGVPNSNNALANRARNDSVGSAHSPMKAEATTNNRRGSENSPNVTSSGKTPTKTITTSKPRQKRKINLSESARKLAEARREFLLKYEHKQPDRTKLTMYDLIYYNPVTNPIKKTDNATTNASRINTAPVATPTEPKDDGPDEDDDECDDPMPVPQVKVGPDGHLVLGERSLVIEHTGTQKNREALARTEALVVDESNGNGFYKKRQKPRDWPKWETLKFYKALNTVGTDFLLMQTLFPQRTRKEIKMKFKREEKLNRRFVEKALVYHQEFDIESLQQDLASFEETETRESKSTQSEKSTRRKSNGTKRSKKSRRLTAMSINEEIQEPTEEENTENVDKTTESLESETTLTASKSEKKKTVKRRLASPACSSTSSSVESESDPEVYVLKPTRSGRYPKTRKLQAPAINTLDNLFSDPDQAAADFTDEDNEENDEGAMENKTHREKKNFAETPQCQATSSIPNTGRVVPGSLVIVSRESADEPGETVLQVYMVSSDIEDSTGSANGPSMTPIKLTPELLDTVTAGISNVDPITIDDD